VCVNANLLALSLDALGTDFPQLSAALLRESHSTTQSALDLLLPVVIASLAQKGATLRGGAEVASLIGVAKLDVSSIDNIERLLTGPISNVNKLLKVGTIQLIPGLFGNASASLVVAVSGATGIRRRSATTLLAMLVAVVLTVTKRQILTAGRSSNTLCSLLRSQLANVRYKLDSNISSAAGILGPAEFPYQLGSQPDAGMAHADVGAHSAPGGVCATPVTEFRPAWWQSWRLARSERQMLGLGN